MMLPLSLLTAAQSAAAEAATDSTVVHVEKHINDLTHMPLQDVITHVTTWVITFGKNLLLAVAI